MDVGMVLESAGPGVKDTQGTDLTAEELRVPRQVLESLKGCAYQYGVQDPLV